MEDTVDVEIKNNPIIEFRNVTKIYNSSLFQKLKKGSKEIKAVEDVSFVVREGDIYGLLGANGSGKTTIIKLICGLIKKDCGEIKVFGKNIETNLTEVLKDIGALVESPTMFKEMTGLENLQYFAMLHGNISQQRILDIIELVGLTDRKDSKFSTYSLGMKQRLGIAQAIMSNPKLLILDEPVNGLDPGGIIQMRDLFKKIRDNYGTTILISSHILSEMQALCDKVAILNKGHIVVEKTLDEIENQENGYTIAKIECSDPTLAASVIEQMGDVEVKIVDNFVYIKFKGDRMAEINKELVLKDISVTSLSIRKRTLEDVYKELMKDEK